MPTRPRLISLICCLVLVDQVSKSWAVVALDDGRTIDILGSLRFALGFNSGIAFSLGQNLGPLVGIVAVAAVTLLWRALTKAESSASAIGLAFIIGGAIGNISDRVFRGDGWLHGKVVDFIDLQWFPIFNVADSAITVGVCVMLMTAVYEIRHQEKISIENDNDQ